MSGDIGLFIQSDGSIDIQLENNDLATDEGLRTAVLISLFTDRRVDQDELPPEEERARGWWADLFPDEPGDVIGSRLWLLQREKRTVETLNRAEEYCSEALQWMIDDGVAGSVDVSASYDSAGFMIISISIQRPDLKDRTTFRFRTPWEVEGQGG